MMKLPRSQSASLAPLVAATVLCLVACRGHGALRSAASLPYRHSSARPADIQDGSVGIPLGFYLLPGPAPGDTGDPAGLGHAAPPWSPPSLLVDVPDISLAPPGYTGTNCVCDGGAADVETGLGINECAELCTRDASCAGFLYNDARLACRLLNTSCCSTDAAAGAAEGWRHYRHACEAHSNVSACEGVRQCMWVYTERRPSKCTGRRPETLRQPLLNMLAVPLISFLVGVLTLRSIAGKLLIYFGGQTLMNLLAKIILSEQFVSDSGPRLEGVPAPFLLTGITQLVAMLCFGCMTALGRNGVIPYVPRAIASSRDVIGICAFGLAFGMNISFGNLGLSLLPLSVNLVIGSCKPLFVYLTQLLLGRALGTRAMEVDPKELTTMVVGVACACMVVLASSSIEDEITSTFFVGVLFALLSVLTGSLNFVIAGMLGDHGLNALDSTGYMTVPALAFSVFPFLLMRHPVNQWYTIEGYPDTDQHTDLELLRVVLDKNPSLLGLLCVFGLLAAAYNVMQFWLVQTLSAPHTSFASNFNKAATIVLAMVIGWERYPSGPLFVDGRFVGWDWLKVAGILGNIAAFAAYNHFREAGKGQQEEAVQPARAGGARRDEELKTFSNEDLQAEAQPGR